MRVLHFRKPCRNFLAGVLGIRSSDLPAAAELGSSPGHGTIAAKGLSASHERACATSQASLRGHYLKNLTKTLTTFRRPTPFGFRRAPRLARRRSQRTGLRRLSRPSFACGNAPQGQTGDPFRKVAHGGAGAAGRNRFDRHGPAVPTIRPPGAPRRFFRQPADAGHPGPTRFQIRQAKLNKARGGGL